MEWLADALCANSVLEELSLASNQITEQGIPARAPYAARASPAHAERKCSRDLQGRLYSQRSWRAHTVRSGGWTCRAILCTTMGCC